MRRVEISRKTEETDVSICLDLDGSGHGRIDTGIGFFDHMLTLFALHGGFDLDLTCRGDLQVDAHHSVEDVGILLGLAFMRALGDKTGIARYGSMVLPMDEALILSAVDFSGRAYLGYDLCIPTEKVGNFDTELVEEFWAAFVRNAACSLHIRQLAGKNAHHIIEGAFKSVGRSLRAAVAADPLFSGSVPSTKGVL